jgi:hypothetical protein
MYTLKLYVYNTYMFKISNKHYIIISVYKLPIAAIYHYFKIAISLVDN